MIPSLRHTLGLAVLLAFFAVPESLAAFVGVDRGELFLELVPGKGAALFYKEQKRVKAVHKTGDKGCPGRGQLSLIK